MIMKSAPVVKIGLIDYARVITRYDRARNKFGWEDELVISRQGGSEHFASRYERQADYVPRHRHERDRNWGTALSGQS